MPTATASGTDIFYVDTGDARSERAVLALHSLGADHRIWSSQIELLRPHTRVLAADCRGHGRSGWSGQVALEDWAADIDAVLDHAGIDVADLLGISMGGLQAVHYAASRPERVGLLVLADTFLGLAEEVAAAKLDGSAGEAGRLGMERYAERYVAQTILTEPYGRGAAHLRDAIARMSPEAYASSARACFEADVREDAARVRTSTLVLWGERDEKTPRELSEELARHVPRSELKTAPGAGHLSNLDNPAAFNELVAGFLGLVRTPPGRQEPPGRPSAASTRGDA
jgi:3-oxoadipate enol-lactonase